MDKLVCPCVTTQTVGYFHRRARRERREIILVSQELKSFCSNFKFFVSEDEIMSFPFLKGAF